MVRYRFYFRSKIKPLLFVSIIIHCIKVEPLLDRGCNFIHFKRGIIFVNSIKPSNLSKQIIVSMGLVKPVIIVLFVNMFRYVAHLLI